MASPSSPGKGLAIIAEEVRCVSFFSRSGALTGKNNEQI
jgi:hypothetical protein